jgi:hypothetical protein
MDNGKGKAPDEPKPAKKANAALGGDLLLNPKYWVKRQYVSRKSQGKAQGRFMRPCYSRVSTKC